MGGVWRSWDPTQLPVLWKLSQLPVPLILYPKHHSPVQLEPRLERLGPYLTLSPVPVSTQCPLQWRLPKVQSSGIIQSLIPLERLGPYSTSNPVGALPNIQFNWDPNQQHRPVQLGRLGHYPTSTRSVTSNRGSRSLSDRITSRCSGVTANRA